MKKFFALILAVFTTTICLAQGTNSQSAAVKNPAIIPATRSSPTNWLARHEGFVKQAKAGGIDVLFMGDSITDGWRNSGKAIWEKYYGQRHAANFGIGGDRTQHVLWRIQNGELDGIKPKVVMLMIGTNNTSSDSAEQIAEGVGAIVKTIQKKYQGRADLMVLGVFPRGKMIPNPGATKILEINKLIAK